jgi:hypothetical protein
MIQSANGRKIVGTSKLINDMDFLQDTQSEAEMSANPDSGWTGSSIHEHDYRCRIVCLIDNQRRGERQTNTSTKLGCTSQ